MKAKVIALVLASAFVFSAVGYAAPPATKYQSTLTDPTAATAATIQIIKASKIQIKAGGGNVTFALKLNGVVAKVGGAPDSSTGNTLEVQFLVGGVTHSKDFTFNTVNGKIDPTTSKFIVSNSDTATWGSALAAGTPIEIRRVRVIQFTTGEDFGVDGITTK
jgi:hypothetical protein